MNKSKPSYLLADFQKSIASSGLNITATAYSSAIELGMRRYDISMLIQNLKPKDFYKSMTSYANNKIWQDVYHANYSQSKVYLKFTKTEKGYLILSLKRK